MKNSLAALLSSFCAQRISSAAFLRQSALCLGAIFLVGLIGTSIEAGGPPVVLSATSLSFSSQIVNTTSGAKLVTVRNRQSVRLTISSVSVTGDFAQTNNCPLAPQTLAPGATCTVSITFTPTAVGTRTGKIVITDDSSTSPHTVSLSGAGSLVGLSAIAITPGSASINKGSQQQFSATGTFTGGVRSNITNVVTWTSSNTAAATVSSTGLASGLSAGTTTIQASSGTISGSASLVVISTAVLQSITVTPSVSSISKGQTQQFVATGTYSDGSSQNLTGVVNWSSSQTGVATISSAGLATGTGVGTATIAASSGTVSGSTTLTVTTAALVSIAITPANSAIPLGTKQQNTATGTYTDGSTLNITSSVVWSSSVPPVATISNAAPTVGLATSVTTGQTTITATFGSIVGSTSLTVTPATLVSVSVTPAVPSIPLGSIKQFTATGTYTDGSTQNITGTVTWGSSLLAVATISNAGLATGKGTGTTTIAATSGTVSGSTTLTVTSAALVSIAITPAIPSIALGTSQQFTATGTYTDGSTLNLTSSVTWSSSAPAVATISNTAPNVGQATSVTTGQSTISATSGSISGSTTLTVTPATLLSITVTPAVPTIALGTTQQFTATGTYTDGSTQSITTTVSWSSNNAAVATVSNSAGTNGLATSAGTGQTTITASLGSVTGSTTLTVGNAALSSIALTPLNSSIALGTTQQFTATGTYTDGSTQNITTTVSWSSSTAGVATISNSTGTNGLATSAGTGQTTITATLGSVTGSAALTVSTAALVSITVSPLNPSIALGSTQQFTATGTYTDGSTQNITTTVSWSSNNAAVATVSNSTGTNGLATSAGTGQTTITATLGSVTGSTALTVSTAALVSITVSPLNPSIALGSTQQFTATGTYTDGSTQNITTTVSWSSNNAAVATVSNSTGTNGLATSAGTGQTTITATLGSVTGSTTLTVSTAALVSVTVSPLNPSIALGSTQQFTATGTYTDGSSQNITTTVSWSSNNAAVATVSNSSGTNGLATSTGTGQTIITATLGSVNGSSTLTVGSAALSSIALSPTNFTITLGATRQFSAIGTYTNGSTQDLSSSALWSSTNTNVFSVSTTGLAVSAGLGTATITATLNGVTGTTNLTVIPVTNLPTVSCFFQNGVVNGGQSYWGNSVTHDNTFAPHNTEVIPAYQQYGNNAVIFDGPVVHIGTPCVLTSVTYFTGISPNTDPHQQHFICQGTGATNGQGATVATTQPVTAGPCAAGDVPVAYTNTYDVGLYCVSNSQGECVYGQLYCNVGPIPYNIAAPAPLRLASFNCNQGAVALPIGDYGVMMATNCDTGSVAAPGGVGAGAGGGDQPCLTGMGESAPFGGGGLNGRFNFGPQIYGFKYFSFLAGPWDNRGGHCLLYDPKHDNSIGLPPSLTSYDNGGCSMVHGQVKLVPYGQAPHTLGFTWWSTQ